jgi:hypothetical protein
MLIKCQKVNTFTYDNKYEEGKKVSSFTQV